MPIERIPGITPEARQVLTVRSVLSATATVMALVDFVKVLSPMTVASPVPEGSLKPENAGFLSSQRAEKIRTISTWLPASAGRSSMICRSLRALVSNRGIGYYVDLAEELQGLLAGDCNG